MDWASALLVTGGSACAFRLINAAVGLLPTPVSARQRAWKWRNICTSLSHSALSGAWTVLCFCRHPRMLEDLISSHSLLSNSLVAVSTGYFIHDFLDLTFNQSFKLSWEVLFHHSVVISCFGLALRSRLYLGFAVVSLLVEVNSVFLHVRQLLLLSGRRDRPAAPDAAPRPTGAYATSSWLNLATFLVFRVCTLGWMARWMASQREHIPGGVLMMGTSGLTLISLMNAVIFYRMIRADFLADTKRLKGRQ